MKYFEEKKYWPGETPSVKDTVFVDDGKIRARFVCFGDNPAQVAKDVAARLNAADDMLEALEWAAQNLSAEASIFGLQKCLDAIARAKGNDIPPQP